MQSSPAMLVRSAILIGFLILLPLAALLGGPRVKSFAERFRTEGAAGAGLGSAPPAGRPGDSKLSALTAGRGESRFDSAAFPRTHVPTPATHAWPSASAAPAPESPPPPAGITARDHSPQLASGPRVAEPSPAGAAPSVGAESLAPERGAAGTSPWPPLPAPGGPPHGTASWGAVEPLPAVTSFPAPPVAARPAETAADSSRRPVAARPAGQAAPAVPSGTPATDQFAWVQWRLRELGALHYVLETWGSEGRLFRFQCQVASPAGPGAAPRHFEATDGDPLRAMMLVLEQVEQMRPLPGP